ncbi:ATP-binding protein [Yinghuangia sp. ASG 101]|uniref:ATP-binding protein n=1 Tax=Yinghuangia sp. ASG 101 TaxID=2896848 RepID=UPI001E460C5D|nr:ATP-binding protein [Yinghuangia sp. ASG 101]UGQ10309.1 ATP-binding protein [Yinghuangia sp. ASG 101]
MQRSSRIVPSGRVAESVPGGPGAPPRSAQLVVCNHATASRTVRRFAVAVLAAWRQPDLIDDTQLIVSELVGNVLRHTDSGHVVVSLRLLPEGESRGALLGTVTDCSAKLPGMRCADDRAEGGRGLTIVDALAGEWGTRGTVDGKEVWFRLTAEPCLTH